MSVTLRGTARAFFYLMIALGTTLILMNVAHAAGQPQDIAAIKMDIGTQNALIDKLEQILPQLTDDASKLTVVTIRLGDLYSERARLKDMAAGETNCNECKDAELDRRRAIAYYEKTLDMTDAETFKRVSLQLAHLYRLIGQSQQAKRLYTRILNNKNLRSVHGKAFIGLGDLAFESGDHKEAKKQYAKAEPHADLNEQTYIAFRQSWNELNLGRTEASLRLMQKALELSKKSGNTSLQRDLMRDYATILARLNFTATDVERFISFSPAEDRAENLKFLGEESERLGNKRGALMIWTQYHGQDKKSEDSAEIQMKLAQNYYDLNNYPQALRHLDGVVKAVNRKNCADCQKVLADFRSLLITWNKKEKIAPSANLTAAYGKYLQLAEEDFEVIVWAGQVARQRGDLATAYGFYEQAALLAHKQKKTAELDMTSTTAIEIAEALKDDKIHRRALNNYLEYNPKGARRHLALYQLADLSYQGKDYARAAEEFQKLALDNQWNDKSLRMQAADLSLDAFAKLNKEEDMRRLAAIYAKQFPEKSQHFSEIARRVTVNKVVGLAKDKKASDRALEEELNRLKGFSLAALPVKDRITHLKTQILAAEKLGDLATVESASRELLKQKSLSAADREFAQKSLLWVYELRLDFGKAFELAKDMPFRELRRDQRMLRVGLLAELAGKNPETYFRKYVQAALSTRNANEIRVKLIRRARNPWKEYDQMYSKLRATPDLLAQITLELHLQKPNLKKVRKALAVRGVYNTAEGQYLFNLTKRDEFEQFAAQLRKAKLDAKNDRALKRSIKSRMNLLSRLNQRFTAAVRGGDLSLQIKVLNTIATENQRFHKQINSLPTPRGLSKKERQLYRQLLAQQSQPFAQAAQEAEKQREQFFRVNDKAFDQLEKSLQSEEPTVRAMARNEYKFLRAYMPRSLKNSFDATIKELQINPKKVAQVRREVENNPLDPSTLTELRKLEAKRANGPLLAYLDERIAQLKTEARR